MRGSLREKADNRWELRVYAGIDVQIGKKRWVSRTVRCSRSEAEVELASLSDQVDYPRPRASGTTMGELLTTWYELASPHWAPNTRRHTRSVIDVHLVPRFGHLAVGKVTTVDLDDFYAELLVRGGHDGIDWMADNHLKGVSAVPAITIHATADFSAAHWEARDEIVVAGLIRAAGLGSEPIDDLIQVHRWRFARPVVIHPDRCLVADGLPPLVLSGDAFGGAKVEGAERSGAAASEAVAFLLGGPDPRARIGDSGADR